MAGEEKKALLRGRFWAIQRAKFIITITARMKATATTMMKMILLLRLLLISTYPLPRRRCRRLCRLQLAKMVTIRQILEVTWKER